MSNNYDFDGWVTKNNLVCSDGTVIRQDAFKQQNGTRVPLVYQHDHNDPSNVLGYVDLENRLEGVVGHASFNSTQKAQDMKECVRHGDLDSFSIYANKLVRKGKNIMHGVIREVSIVLSGANPGAKIENLYFEHSDGTTEIDNEEAIVFPNIKIGDIIEHADTKGDDKTEDSKDEKSVKEIIDGMTEEEKNALYTVLALAIEEERNKNDESKEDDDMKHNAFDNNTQTAELSHDAIEFKNAMMAAISPSNKSRSSICSLADYIEHAAGDYGIKDISYLFPDAQTVKGEPDFIRRDDNWVNKFINGTKHLPFARVKTVFANITADEARAKGYTKGNKKIEEVFTLAKRSVDPTTIYKKNRLDRDDELDITSFDVIAFMKTEMRFMLNEELARAALIGDGRLTSSDDHIDETKIIPIWKDDSLFTIPVVVKVKATDSESVRAESIITSILKARKNYKGSGNLVAFMDEDILTDMLLLEDGVGRRKYETEEDVARAIRVKSIVTVPVMAGQERTVSSEKRELAAIIVDPIDYSFGSNKGGEVTLFDDFDIDFNQKKFLMETRCSGALTKAYSAMAVEVTEVSG